MTPRILADDVEAFVIVARRLSFSRAAEELFLTPQAVSTRIRRLERRLGYPLFRRTTRSVELTPDAEVLLAATLSARAHLDGALEVIAHTHRLAGAAAAPRLVGHGASPALSATGPSRAPSGCGHRPRIDRKV